MLETIINLAAVWAPSLVAIISVVGTVIGAIHKTQSTILELKQDTSFKDLNTKLNKLTTENAELVKCNKILIDEITKIQGYVDSKEE